MIQSPFQIQNQTITKTTVKCAAHRNDQSDRLGGCTVVDCDLLLVDTCATRFYQCTFENCRVFAQLEVAGGWTNCRWIGCVFTGDFTQASYGGRDSDCLLPEGPMIAGCDFSKANLSDVAFHDADLKSIRYPKWPNVTFLSPYENKDLLLSLVFPKRFAKWWFYFSDHFEPSSSSVSFNYDLVQSKLRHWNGSPDITPEKDEVRSILSKLPNVVM